MFGLDVGAFTAIELAESSASGHPNEIAFSSKTGPTTKTIPVTRAASACTKPPPNSNTARSGRAPAIFSRAAKPCWRRTGALCRAPIRAEAGAKFDYGDAGALSFSYMWADKYKAPWHIEVDDFRQNDKKTRVSYLHSLGAKYDFKTIWCWKPPSARRRDT